MVTNNNYKEIKKILLIILALNWIVALSKIIYGIFTNCISMKSDGFHSLFDGVSNIIGLMGIAIASLPKDKNHPYGHKKYETLFSLGIATLIFITCFELVKEGIIRLYNKKIPYVNLGSFLIMIITMIINFFVMRYEYKKGKELNSDILISDSLHTKSDILTSISVIITLIFLKFRLFVFDPITTIIIALFIAYTGFEIVKESQGILCDKMVLDTKDVEKIVLSIEGVEACHKIRTRGRPDDIHIDLHVQVKKDMNIEKAHIISYKIEETIKKKINGVSDVIIHMEPK